MNHEAALDARCEKLLDVCCRLQNQTSQELRRVPKPKQARPKCGLRNEKGVEGTFGERGDGLNDGETSFGEWPHVCAILKSEPLATTTEEVYTCAGSLISESVVLTAGHCVNDEDPGELMVR